MPRGNGHIDICLWNVKDGMPRVIIEVKRCAEDWIPDIREDIKRIRNLLTKKTRRKLTFGILASCIHREVKNNNRRDLERDIESKLAEIQQAIEGKLGNELVVKLEPSRVKPLRLKYSVDSNDWIWQPVVFNVYR